MCTAWFEWSENVRLDTFVILNLPVMTAHKIQTVDIQFQVTSSFWQMFV